MKRWLWLTLLWAQGTAVYAITPETWKEVTFSYQEEQRSLGHFLQVFSQAWGIRPQVSYPGLLERKLSSGQNVTGSPVQILDRLASIHGFQWYVYRNTLYVSDYSSDRTEHILLKGVTSAQAKQALVGAGLFESKFGWSEFERGNRSGVLVGGPASYVSLVKGILGRINIEPPESEERQVMIFPLRYASAIDVEIPSRDGSVVRLGVSNTLKRLLAPSRGGDAEGPGSQGKGSGSKAPNGLTSLSSLGAPTTSSQSIVAPVSNPFGGSNPLSPFSDDKKDEEPIIEAYAALNAVMIKDRPSRKPMYEQIFKILDVPARRVELVATIVDVDVNTLDEWIPQISIGGSRNKVTIQSPGGVDISGTSNVVLVSTNNFLLALKNSESSGQARTHARPSVMTLDNLSAILDLSQTSYFKLLGERTVDVKTATVGTRLKVIPRIMGPHINADMHVQVEIEDGALQAVNNQGELTQSRSSLIATQAIISPGQSLLIGGYRRDSDEKTRSHIPFFSTIPSIGALFRSESNKNQRVERLFVLSARVVADRVPSVQEQARQLNQGSVLE